MLYIRPFCGQNITQEQQLRKCAKRCCRYLRQFFSGYDFTSISIENITTVLYNANFITEPEILQQQTQLTKGKLKRQLQETRHFERTFLDFLFFPEDGNGIFYDGVIYFFYEEIKSNERLDRILGHINRQEILADLKRHTRKFEELAELLRQNEPIQQNSVLEINRIHESFGFIQTILNEHFDKLQHWMESEFEDVKAEIHDVKTSVEHADQSIRKHIIQEEQKTRDFLSEQVQFLINFVQGESPHEIEAEQASDRQIMLKRVKDFWIEEVLEKSLHKKILLRFGKQEAPHAIPKPFDIYVFKTVEPLPRQFPHNMPIIKMFEEMGRALLILGEPGAGKTITLLELAQDAINEALYDPSKPIPVILKLSSWAEHRHDLFTWILEELSLKYYKIPKNISKRWLENNELLLTRQ